MTNVTIIVAMDLKRAIGKNGKIPWRLSGDMKHFVETTTGHPVVMGRKTWDSIPPKFRPLPNRTNVVLTRNTEFTGLGCTVMHSPDEILSAFQGQEIFIAGGGDIYLLFMPHANRLLITAVDTVVDEADTFFPKVMGGWRRRIVMAQNVDAKNQFSFCVTEFTKIVP